MVALPKFLNCPRVCLVEDMHPDHLLKFQILDFWKMVALPKLPNCCACASLKTGTLIIS